MWVVSLLLLNLCICISASKFIVSDVKIVTSPQKNTSLLACHNFGAKYQVAGSNLYPAKDSFTYICYEKTANDGGHSKMLMDVVYSAEECLPTYESIGHSLCVKYQQTSSPISDLSVSRTRGYDGGPKWRHVDLDNSVYLHLRSGVEAVVDFHVVSDVNKCLTKPGYRLTGGVLCFKSLPISLIKTGQKVLTHLSLSSKKQSHCGEGSNTGNFKQYPHNFAPGSHLYIMYEYKALSSATSIIQNILITPESDETMPYHWKGMNNTPISQSNANLHYLRYSYTADMSFEPENEQEHQVLYAGGKFKILQLADLHYNGNFWGVAEGEMTAYIKKLLELEKPDFVVFTGDNTQAYDDSSKAIQVLTGPVVDASIPWAMVFGNHDDEGLSSRGQLFDKLEKVKGSKSKRGPTNVDGVGNYIIKVQRSKNDPKDLLRLYFLDSGAYVPKDDRAIMNKSKCVAGSYDWLKYSQIEYYKYWATKFAHEDKQAKINNVPALMFFHIPLVEYDEFVEADSGNIGVQQEVVTSSNVQSGLFQELVDGGDVKATFVGHDHVNTYCYKREGINLCYGGGAGKGVAYTKEGFPLRARIIEYENNNDKEIIRSWKILEDSKLTKVDNEILFSRSK